MKMRLTIGVVLVMAAGAAKSQAEMGIYWGQYSQGPSPAIYRASLDGSNQKMLFDGGIPGGIDVDSDHGKLYWTTKYNIPGLFRSDIDGSNLETILSGEDIIGDFPSGLALDIPGGKVWWTAVMDKQVHKANLDGTGHEIPITAPSRLGDVALDLSANKVYYTQIITGASAIYRADFDGTNQETLVSTGIANPWGIALDTDAGKMYWTNYGTDKIMRANLDGTAVEDLITSGLSGPHGIALDLDAGKMYFTNTSMSMSLPYGYIQRANLDGSEVQTVLAGLYYPQDIAIGLIPEPATLSLLALGGLAMLRRRS